MRNGYNGFRITFTITAASLLPRMPHGAEEPFALSYHSEI